MKKIFLTLVLVLWASVGFADKIFNANGLISSIRSELPTTLSVIGDSTGTATNEWVYLLTQQIANKFPNTRVEYFLWDDTYQAFNSGGLILNAGSEEYIDFTGTQGEWVADGNIADITGDLDVRIKFRSTDYTPAAEQALLGHYQVAGSRGFYIAINTDGTLKYTWTADGTTALYKSSTVALSGVTDNVTDVWIRVTHDVDNGSSDSAIKFYTSTTGITWTQLGDTVLNGSTTAIAAVDSRWYIGCRYTTYQPFIGRIYKVQISDGSKGLDLTAGTIGYPWLNVQDIAVWDADDPNTLNGGPELLVLNASVAGTTLAYWDDNTRRPKAFPQSTYNIQMSLISLGHNEQETYDTTKMAEYKALADNLITLNPLSDIVFVTQNPKQTTPEYIKAHATRFRQLIPYAKRNGYSVIDAFRAMEKLLPFGTQDDDGLHPDAATSAVWADTVYQWLINEAPKTPRIFEAP